MKFGIQIGANQYWGDKSYKKLASLGFTALDFSFMGNNSPIYNLGEKEAEAFLAHQKALADKAGICFSQVHGPWQFPVKDGTDEERAERMEKMKKSIYACSLLGCKHWVIHPIMPFGCNNPPELDGEFIDINLKFMRELLVYAKKLGVTICLENMPFKQLPLSKPEEILNFVREINDENFKICLDTGHVSVFSELNLADEVRRLGKEIRVLHVHDNDGKNDRHMAPYFGVINWAEFGQALKDIGFDGSISLETCPSEKLPPDIYEDMCATYLKIAKSIIE